jgi:HEAT repeat protein/protein-S-isoprenylcysteine O-methyltransferase Ste14
MDLKITLKKLEPVLLVLLALVFTAGLMFASVELPKAVDQALHQKVGSLDVATGQDEITAYKTELYLSHYHIRLIGYICLGLTLILIATGFILEKRGFASAGAIILFLPVFGHFAATMFFLGGLAFLRFLWLPFLDISFDIMRLGDIVLIPYDWLLHGASLIGINIYEELPFIITGLGIFIFLMGVLAWMYGRIRKQNATNFWTYRISRHPQYLGWIIWSYGLLFLPGPNMRQYVSVANSLPWLLATMIIIGVALLEERKMKQKFGETYESYRQKAPFLFPLPRFVRKIFSMPQRLIFRTAYPDKKREIVTVVAFYTFLCIFLSTISTGLIGISRNEIASKQKIDRLVHTIRTSTHRGDIRHAAASLAEIGSVGIDSLIALLDHKNIFVRWYCADALGNIRSEKIVEPLTALLNDPDRNVRRAAAGSLGGSGSPQAIKILIGAFQDPEKGVQSDAARSLGKLGAKDAVPMLIEALKSDNSATFRSSAWALGEIGANQAVQPLVACLEKEVDWHYYIVGEALQKLDSPVAEDAFIAGMNNGAWWMQPSCATALSEMRTEKGFHALIDIMQKGGVRVRRAAVLALSKYPFGQSQSVLKEALSDEDWEVRMYAEAALRNFSENKN